MTDNPLTLALAAGHEAELRQLKEITVADMVMSFVPFKYRLLHGDPEEGLNTFSLGPVPGEDTRLQILFCGPHASELRDIVRRRLGKYHLFRHSKQRGFAASISLDNIEPAPAERLKNLRKVPEPVMRIVPVTLAERIQKTPGYPQAISFLDEIHRFQLIVGCPTRQKFRETEGGVVIEYVYMNEDEAFEAMRLCDECFPKASFATPSNASGVTTVSFSLEGVKHALAAGKSRRFKQLKKRVLPYTDKFASLSFIIKRMLAFERVESTVARSGGFVTVRLRNDKERGMAKARLDAFDFAMLLSEIDPKCMWIALNDHVARVFDTSRMTPSDTIKRLINGEGVDQGHDAKPLVYDMKEGTALVNTILRSIFGWQISRDYTLAYKCVEGRLLWISIGIINDKNRHKEERLKDSYASFSARLPRSVKALFATPYSTTSKSLYVYFVDREEVSEICPDMRGRRPGTKADLPVVEVPAAPKELTELEALLAKMDEETLRRARNLVKKKLKGQ